jgi:hypothetical protein
LIKVKMARAAKPGLIMGKAILRELLHEEDPKRPAN